jgi:Rieske Fe-S protein
MDRKEFIKTCGFACLGLGTIGLSLESCAGSKMITAQISGENMILPLTEFDVIKNEIKSFRKYVVIENDQLQYPICVYRISETEYSALYMRCTHQGTELSAYGDKLVCSAHGSEFDNKGRAQGPPADKALKSFPVSIDNQNLKISLKAI